MVSCNPHVKCILKCALDLSCLEMETYLELLRNPGVDVETLAENLKRDYSTVYKALKNLMDRGFVKREYRILRGGGFKYIYKPIDFNEFKKIASERLNTWIKDVTGILDSIGFLEEKDLLEEKS